MSVTIESTTDSKQAVLAATGGLAAKQSAVVEKPASDEVSNKPKDETPEEQSEASEILDENLDDEKSSDDEELEEKDDEEKRPKKKGGFQKRIDKFRKQLAERDQELEFLRKQNMQIAQAKSEPVKDAAPKVDPTGKPKAADFDSHEEYVEALTDWKLAAKEKEIEAKQRETQAKTEYQKAVDSFRSKVAEFKKSAEDFDELVSDVDDITLSAGLQESILSSDVGPALMYELAKDRNELERIAKLSPIAAAREVGKIEARLAKAAESSKETEIKPKQTKAPPPILPVGAKGSAKSTKAPDEMDFQEFKKWRAQNK